jgi:hypothetical protein
MEQVAFLTMTSFRKDWTFYSDGSDSAESVDDLELSKPLQPHPCLYCTKGFSTKWEAERHKSSVHERGSSWSCLYLQVEDALILHHDTWICCCCGAGFFDWSEALGQAHLRIAHRYGSCTNGEVFYRSDHFRQHLKHSHGANAESAYLDQVIACCRRRDAGVGFFVVY